MKNIPTRIILLLLIISSLTSCSLIKNKIISWHNFFANNSENNHQHDFQKLKTKGIVNMLNNRLTSAIGNFEEALDLESDYEIVIYLDRCYYERGEYFFSIGKIDEAYNDLIKCDLDNIQAQNLLLSIKNYSTKGQITVFSSPSGGDILLNGRDIQQKTPYTITELDAGSYEVKVNIEDETLQQQIILSQGERKTVSLEKKTTAENVLDITSDPSGATVMIDEKDTGMKTPTQIKGLSGIHELVLTLAGYELYSISVNISSNTSVKGVLFPSKNPMSKLVISSNPIGANVKVNGQSFGVTPFKTTVSAGVYQIEISLEGYKTFKGIATVKENETKTIQATLTKKPVTPPQPKTGILFVISEPPGAEVFVNGTFKGATPLRLDNVNEGSYTVKVVLSGYESQTKTFSVVGGQTNKFTFTLKKTATKPATLKIITIPEGAEVYIDGILLGISNNSFTVTEGTHKIFIRLEGYQDYITTITIKGGEVKTISILLKEY